MSPDTTVYGAQFFENPASEWDTLAYEVALSHHEKWDGTGYPGIVKDIHDKGFTFGPELVAIFFDICDVIRAIREKWAP